MSAAVTVMILNTVGADINTDAADDVADADVGTDTGTNAGTVTLFDLFNFGYYLFLFSSNFIISFLVDRNGR